MSTPLGYGGAGNQIILHFTATEAISKGNLVAYNWAVTDDATDAPLTTFTYNNEVSVEVKLAVVDDTTTIKQQCAGVAMADAAAGQIVPVCVFGPCRALTAATHAASTVGDVITAGASGKFVNAATGTHQSPIGMLLEAVPVAGPAWIFVNCIAVPKLDASATTTDTFMGKAF